MVSQDVAPIGVILHDRGGESEELLARFARALRAEGQDVGGLVQTSCHYPNGRKKMTLVDLRTGEAFVISQNLGVGSDACCLDPAGLADASRVLRREIAAAVSLLVINKFAGKECEGEGLAPELFEAVTAGIPVLTTLAFRHKDKWDALTGGAGVMLDSTEQALWDWWKGLRR